MNRARARPWLARIASISSSPVAATKPGSLGSGRSVGRAIRVEFGKSKGEPSSSSSASSRPTRARRKSKLPSVLRVALVRTTLSLASNRSWRRMSATSRGALQTESSLDWRERSSQQMRPLSSSRMARLRPCCRVPPIWRRSATSEASASWSMMLWLRTFEHLAQVVEEGQEVDEGGVEVRGGDLQVGAHGLDAR